MKFAKMVRYLYKTLIINIKYISKVATIWTSTLIAAFQLLGFLCDFDLVFPEKWSFFNRLFLSIIVVFFIWISMFIVKYINALVSKQVTVFNAKNGHRVFVEYGDLFEDSTEKRSVVVTVNRCFDTIVDNDLISETTIHGMAIKKICTDGYNVEALNTAIQDDLANKRYANPQQTLDRKNKRKGNLSRFPVGTVAEFKKFPEDNITYYFLAMSAFNRDLHPETTDEEYLIALQRLIEHCNSRSQRLPIYMPIIGTNGRNNKKNERELLEYMISTLRFNEHLINTDIHIVVYLGRRDEVSIQGL